MIKDYKMSPWEPTTDKKQLKILGKAIEECSELSNILARCIIQGIDEVDPKTGKPNRQALEEELADVQFCIDNLRIKYDLSKVRIEQRADFKFEMHQKWYNDEIT